MREQTAKMVKYDKDKLKAKLKEKNMTKKELSQELGYSYAYLDMREKRNDSEVSKAVFTAMCSIIGTAEEELLYQKTEGGDKNDINDKTKIILDNLICYTNKLHKEHEEINETIRIVGDMTAATAKTILKLEEEIKTINGSLNKIESDNEAIWNKVCNINVADVRLKEQIGKLKLDIDESLEQISEKLTVLRPDESERLREAKLLVKEMIDKGRTEENDIYNEAAKRGIAKKYIDRAKSEMGIVTFTKGYAKDKSKIWQFKQENG